MVGKNALSGAMVFRLLKAHVISKERSDSVDVQADSSLCLLHKSYCRFYSMLAQIRKKVINWSSVVHSQRLTKVIYLETTRWRTNRADPDQMPHLIWIYIACKRPVCNYQTEKVLCLKLRQVQLSQGKSQCLFFRNHWLDFQWDRMKRCTFAVIYFCALSLAKINCALYILHWFISIAWLSDML